MCVMTDLGVLCAYFLKAVLRRRLRWVGVMLRNDAISFKENKANMSGWELMRSMYRCWGDFV